MEEEDKACWLSLPIFKGEYAKIYAASDAKMWHGGLLAEANWLPTDTLDSLTRLTEAKTDILAIVYRASDIPDSWHTVAAFAKGRDSHSEYIISNRPWEMRYTRAPTAVKQTFHYELYDDHEITPESELNYRLVPADVGQYYRDLMLHKHGLSGAYDYALVLIDGQVAGILGLMPTGLYQGGHVLDFSFGTCLTSKRYPRLGRLIRLGLTTSAFRTELSSQAKGLANSPWTGLTETTFCVGPTPSQDRGIFKVLKREPWKVGPNKFKIRLYSDVREMTYKQAIERWLKSGTSAGAGAGAGAVEGQA
jgi:hypothetical protein